MELLVEYMISNNMICWVSLVMETPLLYVNLNERRDEKLGNELPASSFGDKPIGSVLDFTRISMLKAFRKMEF